MPLIYIIYITIPYIYLLYSTGKTEKEGDENLDQIGRSERPGERTDMMSLGMLLPDMLSLLMVEAGEATEWLRGDRRLISELAGDGC